MKSGVNNDSTSSTERGGGRGQGQGLGRGGRGGGHATLSSEEGPPQQTARCVAPRELTTAMAAGQPWAPPPRRQDVEQQHESVNEEVKVKEEEQTLGQLRNQLTRVPAPGPRGARVLIKIEDSTSGEEVNGGGEGDTLAGSVHQEGTAQGRKQRETQPYSGDERGVGAGAGAVAPASRRARLPPGSYADSAVQGDEEEEEDCEDDEEEEEEEDDEEEEGEDEGDNVSRGAAIRKADDGRSSRVTGVSWNRSKQKWGARHRVSGKQVYLGSHATEEGAAQAVDKYVKDGVDHVEHKVRSSQFKGVSWHKRTGKWTARCKEKHIGLHATEEAAARAYNKEAERIGLVDLNVIPPAGDADDGSNTNAAAALALPGLAAPAHAHAGAVASKRAAPPAPAPPQAKKMRQDTSAGTGAAATAVAAAKTAAGAPARAAEREAALEARITAEKAKTEVAEAKVVVAEAHVATEKAKAALAEKQLAAHVAEQAAGEAQRKAA